MVSIEPLFPINYIFLVKSIEYMTLIIHARCADASIMVSDRRESTRIGYGEPVKKYYLASNCEYALAFSGDGLRIDLIFSTLDANPAVTSLNIKEKLRETVRSMSTNYGTSPEPPEGFLVIRENSLFKLYKTQVVGSEAIITDNNSPTLCVGIDAAKILANYLLDKKNLESLPWQVACKYLIAVMRDVAENVDSVGRLEQFGFDMIVFADSGDILECSHYTDTDSETIGFDFLPDNSKDITPLFQRRAAIPLTGGSV